MNEQVVRIRGIDSLLFRDGRPFGAELGAQFAQTLMCPYPSTVAGFIRTLAGNYWGVDWKDDASIQRVLGIHIQAPLLERNGELVFRAPADAVLYESENGSVQISALRPVGTQEGEGCDLPEGISPLMPTAYREGKPPSGYHLWKWSDLSQWLADSKGDSTSVPEKIQGMEVEERVHVAIDDEKGSSKEQMLFSVQFLSFERYRWQEQRVSERWSLLARVTANEPLSLQGVGLLGGEKRLAAVDAVDAAQWIGCPPILQQALQGASRVRMFLATPAVFSGGWKPGWLDDSLSGCPPCAPGVKLRLVSAAVNRREAVSGWDYREGYQCPKPVRWLAPAGSVYFFEVLEGEPATLAEGAWLQSVCDDQQDRRDGYGLALWGIW